MNNFLPFALPEIGQEEIDEVVDSLKSGWITTGPKAKKFEEDFQHFLGENDLICMAVNSATSGLHLALEAIGVRNGDEVIVPSYTFTATAEIVRYLGATPVIVDVLEDSYNIDPNKIIDAITSKTKAIIPVHFSGLSCDMEKIINIAKKYNLRIIEDAAHSLPTKYKGKKIGTLNTDVTVFSFYANKTMTTAEGGMIVTKNKEIADRCKIMRLHGINRDAFDRYTSEKPTWYYEIVAPGFKYNMPDICAAIGIHQLKKLNNFHEKRIRMADRYLKELKNLPITLPYIESIKDHAWHLFTIRLNTKTINRNSFIEKMAEKGIGCSVHFIPLHLQPYCKKTYNLKSSDFKISQSIYENVLSIPLYTKMTEQDQTRVISAIREILKND